MSKIKLLPLIVLISVALQNHTRIKNWFYPPQASGNNKVVLYSTTWCGNCVKTRKYFAQNHIPYQDIDVETTDEGKLAYQRMGSIGVPIIIVNNDKVIVGFDTNEIEAALRLHK